jgi:hypothetical protein
MPALVEFTQGAASVAFGFQATLVLVFSGGQTAAGNAPNSTFIMGAMDTAGNDECVCAMHADATNNVGHGLQFSLIFLHDGVSATSGPALDGVLARADATHTATGINLTWTTNDGVARRYVALAFSSSEVLSSSLDSFQYPTSPGSRAYGYYWPHTADVILHFGTWTSTVAGDAQGGSTISYMRVGAVDANLDQFSVSSRTAGAVSGRFQQAGQFASVLTTTGGQQIYGSVRDIRPQAGITLEFPVASGSNQHLSPYVHIKCAPGYSLYVGSFTGETGTPTKTQDIAMPGTPRAVMVTSVDTAAQAADTPSYGGTALQFGAAISGAQFGVWAGKVDTADPSDTYYETSRMIVSATAGTPTLNSRASVASLAANNMQLSWDTLDATARQYFYVALLERTDVDAGYGLVRIVVPNTTDPRSIYQAVSGATPAIGDEFQWDDASGHNIDSFGVITGPIGTFQAKYREKGGTWTSAATITLGAPVAGGVSGRLSMSALRRRRRT